MIIISCSGRFHAFTLAEQLEEHGLLTGFYTTYAWQKNTLMRHFTSRIDKEEIPVSKIHTALPIAMLMRVGMEPYTFNELFDKWVARKIARDHRSKVFIGWSGMSLRSIRKAKEMGKATIVERGSAHIQYQDKILAEEYKRFGIRFNIDPRVVEKEMLEYEDADFISVPSTFSKKSFLEYGVSASKLIVNNYGVGSFFKPAPPNPKQVFRVVYLGSLTIQKGMIYLFQALNKLNIPGDKFEAWFIGKVDDEIKGTVEKYTQSNWKFFGHVNHYDLPKYLTQCDVAAMPSVQDGFGMVIPQLLGCGMPVIVTSNTAGEDIIENGYNGFIVPIRDPDAIADKIKYLYENRPELEEMKVNAEATSGKGFTWDDYGNRYVQNLEKIVSR